MPQHDTSELPEGESARRVSRRHLLVGGAAAGAGAVAAVGIDSALGGSAGSASTQSVAPGDANIALFGEETVSPYGKHQAGILEPTPLQANIRYAAYRLNAETDAAAIKRMLRVITGDIERLTQGRGALADSEPELAATPARLTVTVGFGPELVRRVNPARVPDWLAELPGFKLDKLDPAFSGGDLMLNIQSDDPLTVAHAHRMFVRDLTSFASVHWVQTGFRRAAGVEPEGTTMRNMMGQVDGTMNPDPAVDEFDGLVWEPASAGWLAGGSAFVLRRINMLLDTWDKVARSAREETIGRDLAVGAPLTGTKENDPADFDAVNSLGLPVIPDFAHIRRARSINPDERILRRGVNFEENGNAGLLFGCYQADPLTQFVPIQQRLDELDLLNQWIVHVGSAVFAIPPGYKAGGFVGETLFA
jgi:dye decolorizing peroxidase